MAEEVLEEMEEGEGRSVLSVLILLLLLVVLIGAYMFIFNDEEPSNTATNNTETQENISDDTNQAMLVEDNVIFAQAYAGDEFVTASATLEEPGYVVVHEYDDGSPGAVIGYSEFLPEGQSQDVIITIDRELEEDENIFVMLYSDDGDEKYDYPESDLPVTGEGGGPIMMMVIVGPASSGQSDTTL